MLFSLLSDSSLLKLCWRNADENVYPTLLMLLVPMCFPPLPAQSVPEHFSLPMFKRSFSDLRKKNKLARHLIQYPSDTPDTPSTPTTGKGLRRVATSVPLPLPSHTPRQYPRGF